VEDYYQAKDFYEQRGLVFNPALERGSPAAYHVTAQAQLQSTRDSTLMKDFFVSYNSVDKQWAEWIAWILEEAGYSVVIQAWDFRPGANFVLEMHKAAQFTKNTIAVLSENYLKSVFAQPEWAAALLRDPNGNQRTLIPIRVGQCKPTGLLAATVYVDLVGLSQEDARVAILGAFSEWGKPATEPPYPGTSPPSVLPERIAPQETPFPGVTHAASVVDSLHIEQVIKAEVVPRKLSPGERLSLMESLNALPPQQFNMLVFAIEPPNGLIPPMPAPQADRTHALLVWAEGPSGCGLGPVTTILGKIIQGPP